MHRRILISTHTDGKRRGESVSDGEPAGPVVGLADLAVFADPLRARIVTLLADEPLCTCHLVGMLPARQPTVSHHLKVLREAGLVRSEPVGRYTYYRLVPAALEPYARLLADLGDRADRTERMGAVPNQRLPCE
ncbi:MAG: ArsR/SmtB family transcription factor [Actinomycetes bacterium]